MDEAAIGQEEVAALVQRSASNAADAQVQHSQLQQRQSYENSLTNTRCEVQVVKSSSFLVKKYLSV